MEMCKDWFYIRLLKITSFQQSAKVRVFRIISPRLWKLGVQIKEVYCPFEVRKTLRAAKDERLLLSCLERDPIMAGFMKKSLIFKTRKWRRQFVFFWTLPSMVEWSYSCCDVGNCQYLLFVIISFGYCKRESPSLFFVRFIVVVGEIYTSVACAFGDIWANNVCFLSLLTVVFLALWFANFFLTYFKASTSYGLFSSC